MLWEVSGNALESPSYLFGTIHLGDDRVTQYDSTVLEKLKASDAFAMELDPTAVDPMKLMQMMVMPDSIDLFDYMDSTEWRKIDSVFKAKVGMSYKLMERLYPITLVSVLMESPSGPDDVPKNWVMPDIYLKTRAEWLKKEVIALESIETQIKALASIPIAWQFENLLLSTRWGADPYEGIDSLITFYLAQDIDFLYKYTSEESAWQGADSFLLEGRNREMTQTIMSRIHSESLFVAVGAAHLGGSHGLIALLRENGYDVKPVKFNFLNE